MNVSLKRAVVVALGVTAAVGIGLVVFYRHFYIPHFEVVEEGVLYRSGQPDRDDLERLSRRYGVRTIVNLRLEGEQTGMDGPTLAEERAEAERLGMRFIHLPMDNDEDPNVHAIRTWLEIMRDKSRQPVLVLCKRGVDRTGLLVMAYRMETNGWTPQQALDEASSLRFKPDENRHIKEFILSYRRGMTTQSTRPPTTVPTASNPFP